LTGAGEAKAGADSRARAPRKRLLIHFGTLAWIAFLVLVLQIIPYPDVPATQRFDAAGLCVRHLAHSTGECLTEERTALPSSVAADATTVATYRVNLTFDDRTQAQALMIPRAIDALQVMVNGVAVTPTRNEDEPLWHDWNKPTYIGLPAPLLRAGSNTIEIMLRRDSMGRLALYPFYVGNPDALQTEWLLRFAATVGASRMNWAIAVILTFASLALWRMSPRTLGFGWLTLTGLAALLSGAEWAFPNLTPRHPVWTGVWYFSVQGVVYFVFRFLYAFFGDPSRLYLSLMHALIAVNTAFLVVASAIFGVNPDAIYFGGVWLMAILMLDWLLSLPAPRWKETSCHAVHHVQPVDGTGRDGLDRRIRPAWCGPVATCRADDVDSVHWPDLVAPSALRRVAATARQT